MRGVWGGTRGWIHVESPDDSTWEGRTTATPLGPTDDWGAQDVQNEFPDEGRQTAVPCGWMPGGVRDTSGNAGALRAPARPRHRGNIGGGQPPPTKVPPVRPAGLQEGAQWVPPGDQPVQDGSGEETTETRSGRDRDHIGEGVPRLREEDAGGDGVSVPREGDDEHGRRLASGGREYQEGAGDLGEAGEDLGTGGGGPEIVTQILYCRDTAGPPLRGGYLGPHQEDGGCPGRVPG